MASGRRQYPFHLIEPKWQQRWDEHQAFRAFNPGEEIPADHPFAARHGLAGKKPSAAELPPKFYILDMFPYPSGAGLHVGHPEGYTATDILARYKRACGFHVLHPMGWDAFGLPAEQYAVKTGQHPRETTEENIATFKRQIKSLGFSYDWSRELATTDRDYFKWTQWIFLKLYNSWFNPETNRAEPISTLKYPTELEGESSVGQASRLSQTSKGISNDGDRRDACAAEIESSRRAYRDSKRLAYVGEQPVWWCEQLGTVLANEEVVDGMSEVGGFPVVRKPMSQWILRITAYAEKLLNDLDTIDWSNSLKEMQRNWIGRSEGAEVDFEIADCGLRIADFEKRIRVFTTRPDTLFGATYMVLAPEHKLVNEILPSQWPKGTPDAWKVHPISKEINESPLQVILSYFRLVTAKSDLERTDLAKEKTGVFTGAYAINPVNGERIPIWIADYVLASYGTGAIMAVPAHDTRDFEFATKFNLAIAQVVQPPDPKTDWRGFVDDGTSVNSTGPEISITGLPTAEAKKKITDWLESKGLGQRTINYKLRDWLFSRQRYWGEPFPIVWKRDASGNLYHEALPESTLPLLPPPLDDYKPTPEGQPPLARAKDWVNLPDGSTRETNTMPQWAGSCWYYLRYLDARRSESFCGTLAEHYWMGSPVSGLLLTNDQWRSRLAELFAKTARSRGERKRYVTFAVVGDEAAGRLKAATGLDLQGCRHFIDDQAVQHILNEHGNAETEAARGQLAVTPEDIALIPYVVTEPDHVRHAGKTRRHLDGILYEKRINGFLCCVEEVREGAGLLAVKTLYKRKSTGAHAVASLDQTSETFRRSESIKTPDAPSVKPTPGVDLYVGGTEHAVLHLLYARFWHKVLYDLGYVSTPEPFFKLVNQGLILGEVEYLKFEGADRDGKPIEVSADELVNITPMSAGKAKAAAYHKDDPKGQMFLGFPVAEDDLIRTDKGHVLKRNPALHVHAQCFKMSKSRGNVVNPDDILAKYGADAFRLFEMFMGPLEMVKPWNTKGVAGVYKFLGRVWRLFVDEQSETDFEQAETTIREQSNQALLNLIKLSSAIKDAPPTPAQLKTLHACIKKVTEDLDGLRFNTAISAMMVFVNEAMTWEMRPVAVVRDFLILLQPFAPHLAEELWEMLNIQHPTSNIQHPTSVLTYACWPKFDPALLVEETLEIPVQVNGKLRDVIRVPANADNATLEAAAKVSEKVKPFIDGKTIKKVIVVPKKLVNIVVG